MAAGFYRTGLGSSITYGVTEHVTGPIAIPFLAGWHSYGPSGASALLTHGPGFLYELEQDGKMIQRKAVSSQVNLSPYQSNQSIIVLEVKPRGVELIKAGNHVRVTL